MDVTGYLPIEQSKNAENIKDGDYQKDGLWYCGVCHRPKQHRIELGSFCISSVPCSKTVRFSGFSSTTVRFDCSSAFFRGLPPFMPFARFFLHISSYLLESLSSWFLIKENAIAATPESSCTSKSFSYSKILLNRHRKRSRRKLTRQITPRLIRQRFQWSVIRLPARDWKKAVFWNTTESRALRQCPLECGIMLCSFWVSIQTKHSGRRSEMVRTSDISFTWSM